MPDIDIESIGKTAADAVNNVLTWFILGLGILLKKYLWLNRKFVKWFFKTGVKEVKYMYRATVEVFASLLGRR